MHNSAQQVAELFPVVPLHGITGDGDCTCRNRTCTKRGKHPRLAGWKDAATRDPEQVKTWLEAWPNMNLAVITGNGLVVVDIDGPEGEARAAELGLPDTVEVKTGRGRHLYYRGDCSSSLSLHTKVDVLSTGRMAIAPPSRHSSGRRYEWVRSPWDYELADLPYWATARRESALPVATGPGGYSIPEGERNVSLFNFGCRLHDAGANEAEIAIALLRRNEDACDVPLSVSEVQAIAAGVTAHATGFSLNEFELLKLGLTPYALTAYLGLRTIASGHSKVHVGIERIAEIAGISETTVKKKAIPALISAGLISKHSAHAYNCARSRDKAMHANEYTFHDPRPLIEAGLAA